MAKIITTAEELLSELDTLFSMDENKFNCGKNEFGKLILNICNVSQHGNLPEACFVPAYCEDVLITGDGDLDWSNIKILKNHGYEVYRADRDCIFRIGIAVSKDNKVLYFG